MDDLTGNAAERLDQLAELEIAETFEADWLLRQLTAALQDLDALEAAAIIEQERTEDF